MGVETCSRQGSKVPPTRGLLQSALLPFSKIRKQRGVQNWHGEFADAKRDIRTSADNDSIQ